jgi:enediyne biosynthesis protein E4
VILSHNQPLAYLHNRGNGGHFVSLRLQGSKSNRDAVGAIVTVIADGQRQVLQRVGGGSFQSASDSRLHFGLNAADHIDSLEIVWPSGASTRHTNLAADTAYVIDETQKRLTPLPGFPKSAP